MKAVPTLRPPYKRLLWFWPLLLLIAAWIVAPIQAGANFPGLSCTADAASFYEQLSYLVLFIPAAGILLFLTRLLRRRWANRRLRLTLIGSAVLISLLFLGLGGALAAPNDEQPTPCPSGTSSFHPLHCWKGADLFEMNASASRPTSVANLMRLASDLAAVKPNASTYEAFLLDTEDPSIASYSNGRLFVLQHLGLFGSACTAEAQNKFIAVQSHRVGFYRAVVRQSPPVNAFFLQDRQPDGQLGYEVVDFRHAGELLPYVRPPDITPAENAYLDRVTAAVQTLNDDLDQEQQTSAPTSTLVRMRSDFERLTQELAVDVPPRLIPYRDSRLKRYLQNYDLILTAEESAAQGSRGSRIHTSAYEDHRNFYFEEPRVTRLIGYLYLQEPDRSFTDDELSTANWAVF
jgi:hypothetical protein